MNTISEVLKSGSVTTGPKGLFEKEFARHADGESLIVLKVRHRTDPAHLLRRS